MKAKIAPRIQLKDRPKLEQLIPLSTPFVVFVDPASACNLQCKFCPTGDRKLMRKIDRWQGAMDMQLFTKILHDITEFPEPVKVLRMYKDGEPLVNPHFAEMIKLAKKSNVATFIDTTTNGVLLTPEKSTQIIDAGIDRINISVNGLSSEQFYKFTGVKVDFQQYLGNLIHLHHIKGNCEICIKATREVIGTENEQRFYDVFGDVCDRIFVENAAPCWPEFDVKQRIDAKLEKGIYQNELTDINVCPYIFYSVAINADGTVSLCFLDWERSLVIGNVKKESLHNIWHSDTFYKYRIRHLKGERKLNKTCADCGQLTHGMPDDIDKFAPRILKKLEKRN